MAPVHQLTSCEMKSDMFVKNKTFWPKYRSIIQNNASSSEKAHLLLSSHNKIHSHIFFRAVQEEALLWIEELYSHG